MADSPAVRAKYVRAAVRLEVFTVGWMVIEAGLALGAGIVAGSFLLIAFGLDSVIELISGSVLLWRLRVEGPAAEIERVEQVERAATRLIAISLTLLCLFVLGTSVYGLVHQTRPESSPLGIALTVAAAIVMPGLAYRKQRISVRIDSAALKGDAAESLTCGFMATTVLVGLVLTAAFGWWWAEDVAALVFLFWLVRETREAFEEAREINQKDD